MRREVVGNYYISSIKYIIYILLFLISFNGVAQFSEQNQIDNLNTVIPTLTENKDLAKAYKRLGRLYADIDSLDMAIDITKLSYSNYLAAGKIEDAANSLMDIGRWHYNADDYETAMEYYLNSLDLFNKNKIKSDGLGSLYHYIGSVYKRQNNPKKAFYYYQKQYDLGVQINDSYLRAEGLYLSAHVLGDITNDYNEVLNYQFRAIHIYDSLGNYKKAGVVYENIAETYIHLDDDEKAHSYQLKSLKLNRKRKSKIKLFGSLIRTAATYRHISKLDSAMVMLNEAAQYEHLFSAERALPFRKYYRELWRAHEGLKDYKNALIYHKKYIDIEFDIRDKNSVSAVAEMETKYQTDQKQIQISALEKEKFQQARLTEVEKKQQKIIIGAISLVLIIVIVFAFFLNNRIKITNNQKRVIESAHHELEEKNQEIMDSILYAKRIQSAILPPSKVVKEYLKESFILYKPKDVVAGDFYWMEHKDGKVLFAAADCTGHGVPGAMVSVVCNNALNRSVREHGLTDPGEILTKTREIVIAEFEKSEEEVKDGMDIALCNLEGMNLQYAGAHNPLWIIRKGEIIETKANKQPIGKFDNPEPYTTHSFDLEQGDSIYIFSDGYVDQFGGEKGKKFKARAFRELLLSIQDKAMEEQKVIIDEAFETWKGSLEQIDDVCVIGVRV